MDNNRKYMTDVIGDKYQNWKPGDLIILDGGTGNGKSTFIIKTLIPYAKETGKNILYLVNRSRLKGEFEQELFKHDNVDLVLYQDLQNKILHGLEIPTYDYLVFDEIHYLLDDAPINKTTDLAYKFLKERLETSVAICMSASGNRIFQILQQDFSVKPENIFRFPKSYIYVKATYLYELSELDSIIRDIVKYRPDEKIVVFLHSIDLLDDMYLLYGKQAHYMCSNSQITSKRKKYIDNECIIDNQFSRQILFTTTVLDNGVSLKCESIKHIIVDLFNLNSVLQAIGRKRPLSPRDSCSFYFRVFDKRSMNGYLKEIDRQLEPAEKFLAWQNSNPDTTVTEEQLRLEFDIDNKILYADPLDEYKVKVNMMIYKKFVYDKQDIEHMLASSYPEILFQFLGEELKNKQEKLAIVQRDEDALIRYLHKNEGRAYYKSTKGELKSFVVRKLGLKARKIGLKTINGNLLDRGIMFQIVSHKDESRKSGNYKKYFWTIEPL